MQIKCSLDIGSWFDILAIYNVKINKCTGRKKVQNQENFKKLAAEIENQIGKLKFNNIIESDEYSELYDANLKTFKMVELAQKDDGLAKQVDVSNYSRFLKKKALQKRFFDSEVKETKVGYLYE